MIVEMFELDGAVVVELTPETLDEESSIRNAKILHKNQLMVCWGDTFEVCHQGDYHGYSGLKMYLERKKEPVAIENTTTDECDRSDNVLYT